MYIHITYRCICTHIEGSSRSSNGSVADLSVTKEHLNNLNFHLWYITWISARIYMLSYTIMSQADLQLVPLNLRKNNGLKLL